jgi:hypothetical protein
MMRTDLPEKRGKDGKKHGPKRVRPNVGSRFVDKGLLCRGMFRKEGGRMGIVLSGSCDKGLVAVAILAYI